MSRRSLTQKRPRASKKRSRLKRTLAISLLVGGVLLETFANVVQLVESHIVHDVVAQARSSWPAVAERAVKAVWP